MTFSKSFRTQVFIYTHKHLFSSSGFASTITVRKIAFASRRMVHLKIWRVVVDGRRTLQPLEIPLLIKIYKKRGMGWLIALDEPIFNKPTKPKEPTVSKLYYDYVI